MKKMVRLRGNSNRGSPSLKSYTFLCTWWEFTFRYFTCHEMKRSKWYLFPLWMFLLTSSSLLWSQDWSLGVLVPGLWRELSDHLTLTTHSSPAPHNNYYTVNTSKVMWHRRKTTPGLNFVSKDCSQTKLILFNKNIRSGHWSLKF